jgi:hypothetical protein
VPVGACAIGEHPSAAVQQAVAGVIALTRPPLAAISGRPARSPGRTWTSRRYWSPAALWTLAISSATRTGDAVASNQGRSGRRMSPPIS